MENIPAVGVDNHLGTFMALDYLYELGHRQIGCVNTDRVGDLWERVLAYREFVSERCGGLASEYEVWAENSYEGRYKATKQLLSLACPPTAIFAADDTIAIGAIAAAKDVGCEIPGDVSVIGFDDLEFSAYLRPSLTTIRQPMDDIGQKAAELLLEVIEQERVFDATPLILLKPKLVVRDSCAPPRHTGD